MKTKKFCWGLCSLIVLCAPLSSCDDDNNPDWNEEKPNVTLPSDRMFILNEGSIGNNNANISFFDPENITLVDNIFLKQNGASLGDVAQDMIKYDDKIYVAVYGSNYLAKLSDNCVEELRVSFSSDPDLQGGVRYLAAEDGYIYASFHGGVVAKINASSLTVEKKLTKLGANLEGVAIEDDKLYVANSYEQTTDPETGKNVYNYCEEMFVIDLETFTLAETLNVATNPNQVAEEDGIIFLVAWGNYKDKGYEFQMIDPRQNNKVTTLGVASKMGIGNDKVYLVYSETDWSTYVTTNTFSYYDIKSGRYVDSSFIDDPNGILENSNIYMISVDDHTGNIYIGATNYSAANGIFYCFKNDGTMLYQYADCGGQNPSKAVFFHLD